MDFASLKLADLPDCASLYVNVFNGAPWHENWRAEVVTRRLLDCFKTPGFYGLAVREANEFIGFALGYTEEWDASKHFYLKEICVATEKQRSGVGSALMEELEASLLRQNVGKIYLLTARETPAYSFYDKQGYYLSPKMIMMAKWLNPR